jgi:uncharacterized membrane protein HdeD (DUF308 family)
MTSNARPSDALQDAVGTGARGLSVVWWLFVTLGVVWIQFGMYVLSYRAGSLAAVTALVGVAFLYGGITELAAASWVRSRRWLFIVGGLVALATGS